MKIVRDMFGNELYVGDTIVYADKRIASDEIGLDLYEIEGISGEVVIASLCSGDHIGLLHYLEDLDKRSSLIRNPYKTAELFDYQVIN